MIHISKEVQFDAGHRLMNHLGQCSNVHGHRYRAVLHVSAHDVDAVGVVLDFSQIKHSWGGWILNNLDHAFIYQSGDVVGRLIAEAHNQHNAFTSSCVVRKQKVFILPFPPTAEYLAAFLLRVADALLPKEITPTKVELWETPSSMASASISSDLMRPFEKQLTFYMTQTWPEGVQP